MKTNFKLNFLNSLSSAKKGSQKGFTLIELLVVVIIIGVLAAIALPNLLGQVAKARQSEAKNNLGAINRGQQAYRLEKPTFGTLAQLDAKITGEFYNYAGGANVATAAAHTASAKPGFDADLKNYASGVYQSGGAFAAGICESTAINGTVTAVPAAPVTCTGGAIVN